LLGALLPPAVCAAIAWETLEHARGSFVDLELADRHNDLLFSARLRTGEPGIVFLVLEHQSTEDPSMPQRMLAFQSLIWDRFRKERRRARLPPVIAVLVSHVPGGWKAARAFEELFDPDVMALPGLGALMPRFTMIIEDLAHLTNAELKARALAPFQKLVLWLLRDARDPARLLDNFDAWSSELNEAGLDHLRVLIEYLFRVVDPVTRDMLRAKLQALGPRAEEITVTIADQIHEEGREEGHREGRLEGRRDTLRSLLVFKFQALDAAAEARLQVATPEDIDGYLRRLLVAESLDAVFED
jgi:predicted transposase/invertase (TIGR01784 family)